MTVTANHDQKPSPAQLGFLRGLFAQLAREAVDYAWLRNYEYFPESIGHDVDIGIRRNDWPKVAGIIRDQASRYGITLAHIHERDFVIALWFDSPDSENTLHIDFFPDPLSWHGLSYLNEDRLFFETQVYKEFMVLRPAHKAMCSFLSSLLWGGFYKEKYHSEIIDILQKPQEREVFEDLMAQAFGPTWTPPFSLQFKFKSSPKIIYQYVKSLRSLLIRRSFRNRFFDSLIRTARHWRGELRTFLYPPGLVVAITGPDGAGKSTVLAAFLNKIGCLFGESISYHWRPSVLPDVGVLLRTRPPATGDTLPNPHGQTPHGRVQSFFRVIYYICDLIFSWIPKIRKPTAKNHLVVFDRYLDDMAVDPRRYRLSLALSTLANIMQFIPRPDLMFVLTADPDVLLRRKQEVARGDLVKLIARYREYYSDFPEAVHLDAHRSVEESVSIMSSEVRKYLHGRIANMSPSFSLLQP